MNEDAFEANPFGKEAEPWISYLTAKLGSRFDFPFGDQAMVFKVGNKMFGLLAENEGTLRVNLKCDPEHALELRDLFSAVKPGYHMNKKHWNTVELDGSLPEGEIFRQIDHSYELVVSSLPKSTRQALL